MLKKAERKILEQIVAEEFPPIENNPLIFGSPDIPKEVKTLEAFSLIESYTKEGGVGLGHLTSFTHYTATEKGRLHSMKFWKRFFYNFRENSATIIISFLSGIAVTVISAYIVSKMVGT